MMHRRHESQHTTAAATDELTMATEGVMLPIGATGFLMSLLMLTALLV